MCRVWASGLHLWKFWVEVELKCQFYNPTNSGRGRLCLNKGNSFVFRLCKPVFSFYIKTRLKKKKIWISVCKRKNYLFRHSNLVIIGKVADLTLKFSFHFSNFRKNGALGSGSVPDRCILYPGRVTVAASCIIFRIKVAIKCLGENLGEIKPAVTRLSS